MKIEPIKVEFCDKMGSDLSVVNAARVSFAKVSTEFSEQDERLVSYLARHGHWTPFAHTSISLRVRAPIFVARQLVKHQVGLVWNEESRRYIDSEPSFYLPEVWRGRPEGSIKQGSGENFTGYIFYEYQNTSQVPLEYQRGVDTGTEIIPEILGELVTLYKAMIYAGVAPEQARMVLPQNTMNEWIWTGNVMSFARVCKQRLDPHAQKETRDVAVQLQDILQEHFPVSFKALMEN